MTTLLCISWILKFYQTDLRKSGLLNRGGDILNELHSRINSNPVQIFLSDLKPVGKYVRFETFCLSLFNSKVHFIILKPVLDSSAAATKSQIVQLNSSVRAHSPINLRKIVIFSFCCREEPLPSMLRYFPKVFEQLKLEREIRKGYLF